MVKQWANKLSTSSWCRLFQTQVWDQKLAKDLMGIVLSVVFVMCVCVNGFSLLDIAAADPNESVASLSARITPLIPPAELAITRIKQESLWKAASDPKSQESPKTSPHKPPPPGSLMAAEASVGSLAHSPPKTTSHPSPHMKITGSYHDSVVAETWVNAHLINADYRLTPVAELEIPPSAIHLLEDESSEQSDATNALLATGPDGKVHLQPKDSANPLAKAGIDRWTLYRLGMPKELADRVFRALFVYTNGFHNIIKEVVTCCPAFAEPHVSSNIWMTFMTLLEQCEDGKHQVALNKVHEDSCSWKERVQQEYEQEKQELNASLTKTRRELDKELAVNQEKTNVIHQLMTTLDAANLQLANHEKAREELKEQLRVQNMELLVLEDDMRKLNLQLDEAKKDFQLANSERFNATTEKFTLEEELHNTRKIIDQMEQEKALVAKRLHESLFVNQTLRMNYETLKQHLVVANMERDKMVVEKQNCLDQIDVKQQEIEAEQQKLVVAHAQQQEQLLQQEMLQQKYDALNEHLQVEVDNNTHHLQTIASLNAQLEEAKVATSVVEAQVNLLEAEKANTGMRAQDKLRIERLLNQKHELETLMESLKNERTKDQEQIWNLRASLEAMDNEMQHSKRVFAAGQQAFLHSERTCEQLRHQLMDLEKNYEKANKNLLSVKERFKLYEDNAKEHIAKLESDLCTANDQIRELSFVNRDNASHINELNRVLELANKEITSLRIRLESLDKLYLQVKFEKEDLIQAKRQRELQMLMLRDSIKTFYRSLQSFFACAGSEEVPLDTALSNVMRIVKQCLGNEVEFDNNLEKEEQHEMERRKTQTPSEIQDAMIQENGDANTSNDAGAGTSGSHSRSGGSRPTSASSRHNTPLLRMPSSSRPSSPARPSSSSRGSLATPGGLVRPKTQTQMIPVMMDNIRKSAFSASSALRAKANSSSRNLLGYDRLVIGNADGGGSGTGDEAYDEEDVAGQADDEKVMRVTKLMRVPTVYLNAQKLEHECQMKTEAIEMLEQSLCEEYHNVAQLSEENAQLETELTQKTNLYLMSHEDMVSLWRERILLSREKQQFKRELTQTRQILEITTMRMNRAEAWLARLRIQDNLLGITNEDLLSRIREKYEYDTHMYSLRREEAVQATVYYATSSTQTALEKRQPAMSRKRNSVNDWPLLMAGGGAGSNPRLLMGSRDEGSRGSGRSNNTGSRGSPRNNAGSRGGNEPVADATERVAEVIASNPLLFNVSVAAQELLPSLAMHHEFEQMARQIDVLEHQQQLEQGQSQPIVAHNHQEYVQMVPEKPTRLAQGGKSHARYATDGNAALAKTSNSPRKSMGVRMTSDKFKRNESFRTRAPSSAQVAHETGVAPVQSTQESKPHLVKLQVDPTGHRKSIAQQRNEFGTLNHIELQQECPPFFTGASQADLLANPSPHQPRKPSTPSNVGNNRTQSHVSFTKMGKEIVQTSRQQPIGQLGDSQEQDDEEANAHDESDPLDQSLVGCNASEEPLDELQEQSEEQADDLYEETPMPHQTRIRTPSRLELALKRHHEQLQQQQQQQPTQTRQKPSTSKQEEIRPTTQVPPKQNDQQEILPDEKQQQADEEDEEDQKDRFVTAVLYPIQRNR